MKNKKHKCIKCKKVILWEPNRCFVCAVELKKSREEKNNGHV